MGNWLCRLRLAANEPLFTAYFAVNMVLGVTSTPMPTVVRPDPMTRRDTALRLWEGGVPLVGGNGSDLYLRDRCIEGGMRALSLRHHA